MAADVEGLRQWIGAERFVMAGGSYGGFIAMEYAIRHPERLSALVDGRSAWLHPRKPA